MGSETASEKANLYNPNPIQNRTGDKKMTFTNIDSVENKVIWKVHWDISDQCITHVYCHVARQLSEQSEMGGSHVRPIRSTISQEISK